MLMRRIAAGQRRGHPSEQGVRHPVNGPSDSAPAEFEAAEVWVTAGVESPKGGPDEVEAAIPAPEEEADP